MNKRKGNPFTTEPSTKLETTQKEEKVDDVSTISKPVPLDVEDEVKPRVVLDRPDSPELDIGQTKEVDEDSFSQYKEEPAQKQLNFDSTPAQTNPKVPQSVEKRLEKTEDRQVHPKKEVTSSLLFDMPTSSYVPDYKKFSKDKSIERPVNQKPTDEQFSKFMTFLD